MLLNINLTQETKTGTAYSWNYEGIYIGEMKLLRLGVQSLIETFRVKSYPRKRLINDLTPKF